MGGGDEFAIAGDQGEMVCAGGGSDDAIGRIAVKIRNAVGITGDCRGEREEFQAIENGFGDPLLKGGAQGESPVGLFLSDLDDTDRRQGKGFLVEQDFTDTKRDLGGSLPQMDPDIGIEQVIHGRSRLAG